jgi:hypothetical protein
MWNHILNYSPRRRTLVRTPLMAGIEPGTSRMESTHSTSVPTPSVMYINCSVYLSSNKIWQNDLWSMNQDGRPDETIECYFNTPYWHFYEGTEENHEHFSPDNCPPTEI